MVYVLKMSEDGTFEWKRHLQPFDWTTEWMRGVPADGACGFCLETRRGTWKEDQGTATLRFREPEVRDVSELDPCLAALHDPVHQAGTPPIDTDVQFTLKELTALHRRYMPPGPKEGQRGHDPLRW